MAIVRVRAFTQAGVPQTISGSWNETFVQKGTVTIGSNTSATGATGSISLPLKDSPYLVFCKTTHNACITASYSDRFEWFMPQGSTTFQWWAYARGSAADTVGMRVYESNGDLRWGAGNRPLTYSSFIKTTSNPSYNGVSSTGNLYHGNTYTIPNGHAVLYSDPGQYLDLYTGFPGVTVQADMRYWPCISTSGTTLTLRMGRRRPNIPPTPGINYQTFVTKFPSWIITAPAF